MQGKLACDLEAAAGGDLDTSRSPQCDFYLTNAALPADEGLLETIKGLTFGFIKCFRRMMMCFHQICRKTYCK